LKPFKELRIVCSVKHLNVLEDLEIGLVIVSNNMLIQQLKFYTSEMMK